MATTQDNRTAVRRLELHNLLLSFCPNCYFQPPESFKLTYPCIVYNRSSSNTRYADNNPYSFRYSYDITAISRDPDSDTPRKIAQLPLCRFNRHFTKDNLNHDIFTLYW